MENDQPNEPVSGSTSPTYPSSEAGLSAASIPNRTRTASITTADNVSVTTAFILPPVPANTPATLSVVSGMTNLDLNSAVSALASLPSVLPQPPATSEISNASSAPAADEKKDDEDSASRCTTPTPKKGEIISPPNEHVHEHSVWGEVAREDLTQALERAKQYAKDKNRLDDTKTVEEHFSEFVAEAINGYDVKFDAKYLE